MERVYHISHQFVVLFFCLMSVLVKTSFLVGSSKGTVICYTTLYQTTYTILH